MYHSFIKKHGMYRIFVYLKRHLLPAIKGMFSDTFIFQHTRLQRQSRTVKLCSARFNLSRPVAIKQHGRQPSRLGLQKLGWGIMQ